MWECRQHVYRFVLSQQRDGASFTTSIERRTLEDKGQQLSLDCQLIRTNGKCCTARWIRARKSQSKPAIIIRGLLAHRTSRSGTIWPVESHHYIWPHNRSVLCKRGRADLPGMIEAMTQIYLNHNSEHDKKETISHFFFFFRLKGEYWKETVLPGLNRTEKTVNTVLPRVEHSNTKGKSHKNKEGNGFMGTRKRGGSAIRLFSNGTQIDRVLRLQEEAGDGRTVEEHQSHSLMLSRLVKIHNRLIKVNRS